ncbi:MAG: DUF1028 domain-containing protein, partial [Actinomycetota bacterium]
MATFVAPSSSAGSTPSRAGPTTPNGRFARFAKGRESDPVAAFSGEAVEGEVGVRTSDSSGPLGTERVAVTGALLADAGAVDDAFDAYEAARAEGRSLDRALADALLAGSEAGGDRRCPEEQTALFAHLAVAELDDD